ncbi:MAG: deoxyribonuclease IV [Simkaniaceae bacterium]|nr:deoxyribonuclease IV [Simkaniaceae bacterium]
MKKEKLLIGAHTSAAGGVHKAVLEGGELGATTIQLFTANQKQWNTKPIAEAEVERWFEAVEKTGLQKIMSHDSYLINLGSPKPDILEKSMKAFENELKRCHQLDLTYLNFHPGAATTASREECLDQIIASLKQFETLASEGNTRLLLETTAGQGTTVGNGFEELAYIIKGAKGHVPIGVCIDTCHIFCAGYDVRNYDAWDKTLNQFDKIIGLEHLYALHVNDSMKPFDSRRDRHASLGQGEIGIEGFKAMMQHPKLKEIPKYLETPKKEIWSEEIQLLREMA